MFEPFSILSESNEKFKTWKKLTKVNGRKKNKAFLVESKKLIAELLSQDYDIEYILFPAQQYHEKRQQLFEAGARFVDKSWAQKFDLLKWVELTPQLFSQLSQLENSDGLIAVVKGELAHKINSSKYPYSKKLLLLDYLQDPGNVGTLIRSAEAFGFDGVISLESVDFMNPKVLRSSMGSCFRVPLYTLDIADVQDLIQQQTHTFVTADLEGVNYLDFKWPEYSVLVVGNEGNGIRDLWHTLNIESISIPMQGKLESLNAAISGSIIMSSISRFN